ncbi:MAG: hypothetical protein ABSC94_23740 [Polyangiaceae bacterium]|jgi:hypothetical protein
MVLRETWLLCALSAVMALGCGKTSANSSPAKTSAPAASAPAEGCSQHAVCGNHFFLDILSPGHCPAGMECTISIKLGATDGFHVNDEYPYKFKADLTDGVQFVGTDPAGQNVFSKPAGNWHKVDEKSGLLAVKFFVGTPGQATITGTFKLSVCSAENCLLEQRDLRTEVIAL